MAHTLDRFFLGDQTKAYVKKHQKTIDRINALEAELQALSDTELAAKTIELRERLQEKVSQRESDPLAMLELADRMKEKKEILKTFLI